MKKDIFSINEIPTILYGDESKNLFLYVHGKHSRKEEAEKLAEIATMKAYQVLSFDLPEHGDRINKTYKCNVQNGVHDLRTIYNYIKPRWSNLSLFACSLGAYFSLMTFQDIIFSKCLFLSPILDMERLIRNMMLWSNVNEKLLKEKKEIRTDFGETLYWDYYTYVKDNPIIKWDSKTEVLYGSKDNLTEKEVIDLFINKYACGLQIVENGEHYFQSDHQLKILEEWIQANI